MPGKSSVLMCARSLPAPRTLLLSPSALEAHSGPPCVPYSCPHMLKEDRRKIAQLAPILQAEQEGDATAYELFTSHCEATRSLPCELGSAPGGGLVRKVVFCTDGS